MKIKVYNCSIKYYVCVLITPTMNN